MKQYSQMSGDIVGSLPVGIKTRENNDVPYWSSANTSNIKEVWVHPSSRWLSILEDVGGTTLVKGKVNPAMNEHLIFKNTATNKDITIIPNMDTGKFDCRISAGCYQITYKGLSKRVNILPGQEIYLDLCEFFDIHIKLEMDEIGSIVLKVEISGEGSVKLTIKADNAEFIEEYQEIQLSVGEIKNLSFNGKIKLVNEPWVAVIIPNHDINQRIEVLG